MRGVRVRRRRWALIAVLALLPVLGLQLLIPAGFMPASDAPLTLQICPEGFPVWLLPHAAHHHHHGGGEHGGGGHCAFGAAGGSGPVSAQAPRPVTPDPVLLAVQSCCAPSFSVRLVHLPQARGPPLAI
ncbi:MAG TPA: hypothetical protein VNX02_14055 [Steroidobacteraceae bacterium]|nr:hypothetical protein [Steroidobacteraceae bacterium]